jgi:GDPmannose 4,6-dehydratase
LGAQSHPPTSFEDPKGTRLTNVIGTENIMNSIEEYQKNCALMFCSTSEVYGVIPEEKQPISENFPLSPVNPYGLSKSISDVDVRGRAKIFNLPFFVTRAFSHTGLRRGNKFSVSSDAYQIAKIRKGLQEPTISVGTLSSKRTIMDARDCVRAYAMLMEKAVNNDEQVVGEIFNVGGYELFTMGDLLDNMLRISGLEGKVKKKINPAFVRPIDIPIQICDTTKLKNLTGWKPEISIVEKTLPDLLNYWDKKIPN